MAKSEMTERTPAEWREMAKQLRRDASAAFLADDPDGCGSDMLASASAMERTAAAIERAAATKTEG